MTEDNRISEFNEASLKMRRIDKLQNIINISSINPLGFFIAGKESFELMFQGQRNFEVKFKALFQLFMEIRSKCDDNEEDNIASKQRVLSCFIRDKYPFDVNETVNGSKREVINLGNWIILEEELNNFEKMIRDACDKHGFSGKESRDVRMAVTN